MSFFVDAFSYFTPIASNADIESQESTNSGRMKISSFSGETCGRLLDKSPRLMRKVNQKDPISEEKCSPTAVQNDRTIIRESRRTDCLQYLDPPRILRTVRSNVSMSEWRNLCTKEADSSTSDDSLLSKATINMTVDEAELVSTSDIYFPGDDETVIASNKVESEKNNCVNKISTKNHTSLKECFDITISAPLALPWHKNVPPSSFNLFWFGQGVSKEKSISSSRSTNAISPDHKMNSFSSLFRKSSETRKNQILLQKEKFLLIGANLDDKQFTFQSETLRYILKRKTVKKKKSEDPATKVEMILNRKTSGTPSPVTGVVAALKQFVGMSKQNKLRGNESLYSDLDAAVKGRLDGIDILSCGSAKRPLSTAPAKRLIVQESLWLQCGRKPSTIVLEGLTCSSKGADRWTVPINKVECNFRERGCYDTQKYESSVQISSSSNFSDSMSISVSSIEQLQRSYDSAMAPLMFGDVKGSIEILKKICVALRNRFKDSFKYHHTLGSTHHNLSNLYLMDDNLEEALANINFAISIRVRCLGYLHESVAVSLAKAGIIYFGLGRLGDAKEALEQFLLIKRSIHLYDRIDVAKVLNNLSIVYYYKGSKKKALKLLFQALKIQNRYVSSSLCRDYILLDTSTVISNIARIYFDQNQHNMSAFFYEETLEYQLMTLDKCHMDVLDSLNNIAFVKLHEGDKTNAMTIYKALYKHQVATYGPKSNHAIDTLCMMSFILIHQSNFSVAQRYLSEVLEWQKINLCTYDRRIQNTEKIISRLEAVITGEANSI